MESPELHPLPPLLARRSSGTSGNGGGAGNGTDVNSTADEEEEEFYSPRGSIGTGSGSRRVFAAVPEGENCPSSSPSPSSSPASSPYRTESMSYSPPVIFGSARPEPKMPPPPPPPRQPHYATSSPASSSSSPSPERVAEKSSSFMDQIHSARSPSLSPISSSPERALNAAKEKLSSASSVSSASSSPERVSEMKSLAASLNKLSPSPTLSAPSSTRESPVRASNASAKKWQILSPERDFEENSDSISNDSVPLSFEFDPHRRSLSPSPSPERVAEKIRDSPPRVSAASESDRKRLSPSPSLSSSTSSSPARVHSPPNASDQKARLLSPEREPIKNKDESPRVSNASEGILFELDPKNRSRSLSPPIYSPERDFHNNSNASQRTSEDSDRSAESPIGDSNQNLTIPTPPPLPPPPTLFLKQWKGNSPRLVTSIAKPPVLIPPSRPFVIPSPADLSVSLVELPPPGSTSPEAAEDAPKPKLKPLHWDKVRASSDREMVWDQLRTSSFKLNEEMIETLFVVKTPNAKPKETTPRSVIPWPNTENRVLDPKKSQNIAISLRALNVTIEEVCEALLEGNAEALGNELLESLLKMAPTKEEERKLKEYKDDSPVKLGPAERFLKAVLDVPFAFKRVDAMLYIANFDSEVDYLKKSLETLEGACEELRNSRMFMKLLEAVLKTGNRMNVGTNRGDAHAFKLDTLLKLVDVKGADGKTTLLHFVVQEIIRTEGARFSGPAEAPTGSADDAKCRRLGLEVVSALSSELSNVKKAAVMDSDVLSGDVSKLSRGIGDIRDMAARVGEERFSETVDGFVKSAEEEIIRIQAQESVALSLVKEITEYFHGNSAKEEAHPFRIFMVVRDFLSVLDRVCKEVGMINERTMVSSAHKFPVPVNPMLAQVLPVPKKPYSSSDEECLSP